MEVCKRTLYVVIVLLAASFILPTKTLASSISIAPLRQELTLAPGQAFSSKLDVGNGTSAPIAVNLSAESFNVTDENYDYSFSQAEGANKWVTFDTPQITLAANDSEVTGYSVGVPANAEPGEQYIAIFASTQSKPTDTVTSVDRAGLLLYITVSGNVTRRGRVLGLNMPMLIFGKQATWNLRLAGTGTAHFESGLTTKVSNIFGHTTNTSSANHLILPSTVRLLQGTVALPRWTGLYRVHFIVGQGDSPAFAQTKWVLNLPLLTTLGFVILLCTVVIIVVGWVRRHKQRWHRR